MPFAYEPPKYAQIVAEIRRRIEAGTYAAGQLLPSEHQLGVEFEVSRPTIVKVLTVLRQDGWVETHQGLGTRVLSPPGNKESRAKAALMWWLDQNRAEGAQGAAEIIDVVWGTGTSDAWEQEFRGH